MSDSVRPHRRQPTRLHRPWDSPGKKSGVGCHFLLQCMKVKSLSRVRPLATPRTAAHQAPPSINMLVTLSLCGTLIIYSSPLRQLISKRSLWVPPSPQDPFGKTGYLIFVCSTALSNSGRQSLTNHIEKSYLILNQITNLYLFIHWNGEIINNILQKKLSFQF